MKKLFLLPLIGLTSLLSACTGQYVHTTEPRSVVYMGQPAADVYENFGKPTKIKRLKSNAQVLIYQKQEIEKDWAYRYFHSCEMQFYMVDDRVSDWFSTGDMCAIRSNRDSDIDWDEQDNGLLSYFNNSPLFAEVPSYSTGRYSEQIPADAFGESASAFIPSKAIYQEEDYGIFDAPQKQHFSTGIYSIPADAF